MTLAEQYLPEFDDEMARTRKVLEAIRKEDLDWSPGANLHSIGWNANHLASIVGWTVDIVDKDEFDIAPVDGPADVVPTSDDPAAILAMFDAGLKSGREALKGASDAKLAEKWALKMGGQALFEMPKGECIRKWVLNHTVHHRGILSTYLRLRGVEVTPVYDY